MLIYPAAGLKAAVYPAIGWIVGNSPSGSANNIYSLGSEMFTEVQFYMSSSSQPGSRVIRTFSDVKKPFYFFDFAFFFFFFFFLSQTESPSL